MAATQLGLRPLAPERVQLLIANDQLAAVK
jgi:hypothetical protein